MPLLAAQPVTVLPDQHEVLEQLVRTHSTPQQLAMRARLILHAADAMGVHASARELSVWLKTVRYWRKRWRTADDKRSVVERLADALRSGGQLVDCFDHTLDALLRRPVSQACLAGSRRVLSPERVPQEVELPFRDLTNSCLCEADVERSAVRKNAAFVDLNQFHATALTSFSKLKLTAENYASTAGASLRLHKQR